MRPSTKVVSRRSVIELGNEEREALRQLVVFFPVALASTVAIVFVDGFLGRVGSWLFWAAVGALAVGTINADIGDAISGTRIVAIATLLQFALWVLVLSVVGEPGLEEPYSVWSTVFLLGFGSTFFYSLACSLGMGLATFVRVLCRSIRELQKPQ